MFNPLTEQYSEEDNRRLVAAAVEGDRQALDRLVRLHQPFIYNVAWKMVHDPNDALDLTQEVLLKVITKLATFKGKSSFRTWLYRIVTNEFLMGKRRKTEQSFTSFDDYGARLDAVPDSELTREEEIEQEELSREMQVRCMSGMLMCLTREQRLIYILGDSFGIDHRVGAEIFEVSPQNFRVKLHRARKELYNYMNNKCGLVNKANPCRCPKKARTLKKMGALDEQSLEFSKGYRAEIADFTERHYAVAGEAFADKYSELFRGHPARTDFDKQTAVTEILENEDLMKYFSGDL